jgi:hypothetical protein
MMSTVGAEGAPDTTAALVLAHSWGAAGYLTIFDDDHHPLSVCN